MVSLKQIAHAHLRVPAWLGIFAILMLFVAPLVSKTLVAQGVPMPMMAGMDMRDMNRSTMPMDDMSDMPSMATMPDVSPTVQKAHAIHVVQAANTPATMSASDMMDAACGYCVLLMHLPLLVMLALPLLWSLRIVVRPSPPRVIHSPISAPILEDSQPRAPPVLVSVVLPFAA